MNKSTKIISVLFLLGIITQLGLIFALNFDYNPNKIPNNSFEGEKIKIKASKTTLLAPEAIYLSMVSFNYYATYSFDHDTDGSNPAGFNIHEGAGYVNVIDSKLGHGKVVEMYDGVNYDHTELHNVFQSQTRGTIEFWILNDDVSDTFSIRLLEDTATSVWGDGIGWIQIWQDTLRYLEDVDWEVTSKLIYDDTWYHIRIDFECTSGLYEGLAQNTWRFYVDGEIFGNYSFLNDISNVNQIYFAQRGADNHYRCYVDAIGYSWDPNYNVGDNLIHRPPENPFLIPIILGSIAIGMISFLGIILFFVRRKSSNRARPKIIYQEEVRIASNVVPDRRDLARYCPNCGSQIGTTQKFCVNCGASLTIV